MSSVIEAIAYIDTLIDAGHDIVGVNCSWMFLDHTTHPHLILEEEFEYLVDVDGVVVVAGAGNGACYHPFCPYERVYEPARFGCVFAVSMVDSAGYAVRSYQNNGAEVDLCGFSANNDSEETHGDGPLFPKVLHWADTGYGTLCHKDSTHVYRNSPVLTSGATAQVTGLVSLVRTAYGELSPSQVKAMILRSCTNVDTLNEGMEDSLGAGYVDAYKALMRNPAISAGDSGAKRPPDPEHFGHRSERSDAGVDH